MGICYVIGAGDFGDGCPVPGEGDFVIAGDGGFAYCLDKKIPADMVIGDFDSLGYRPDHPNVIPLKPEKDDTDMLSAVKEGWKRGYRDFCFYGATGGRISHTIANIQLLTDLAKRGGQGVLIGVDSWYRVISNGTYRIEEGLEGYLSVFCLGDRASGVTEKGLKYELEDAELTMEFPLGVSNELTGKEGYISVKEGSLLLIWEKK